MVRGGIGYHVGSSQMSAHDDRHILYEQTHTVCQLLSRGNLVCPKRIYLFYSHGLVNIFFG